MLYCWPGAQTTPIYNAIVSLPFTVKQKIGRENVEPRGNQTLPITPTRKSSAHIQQYSGHYLPRNFHSNKQTNTHTHARGLLRKNLTPLPLPPPPAAAAESAGNNCKTATNEKQPTKIKNNLFSQITKRKVRVMWVYVYILSKCYCSTLDVNMISHHMISHLQHAII